MDYRQESIATLHDFGAADPTAPLSETAVVVPVTERDFVGLAPEQVFHSLASLEVGRVLVPLRAPAEQVPDIRSWLGSFDVNIDVLWCNDPVIDDLLADHGLDGNAGKGRDVWLAMGLLGDHEYLVMHDADVRSHEARDIRKLAAPLDAGYEFVKAYYARVEHDQLFGRLVRLFFAPLVDALGRQTDADIVRYLASFRYPLAGEMGMTTDLAHRIRVPRRWGLEVGTMGEAFRHVGFEGSVQVDLGIYQHEHRSVSGPTGLSDMSYGVAKAVFHALGDAGVEPDFDSLREEYLAAADRLVDQYEADAWFNGLEFDAQAERDQVVQYADAVAEPEPADRMPAWAETSLSRADLEAVRVEAVDGIH